jgi:hypothetical protein
VTVRKEEGLEQNLEASQVDAEDEHSEECLNAFSQEAVALKLKEKQAGEDDEHSEEWLNIFSQEAKKTATWEFTEEEEEEAESICFVDLWE